MWVWVSIHKESLTVTQKYRNLVFKESTPLICIILDHTSSEDNGNDEVGVPRWWKLHLNPHRTWNTKMAHHGGNDLWIRNLVLYRSKSLLKACACNSYDIADERWPRVKMGKTLATENVSISINKISSAYLLAIPARKLLIMSKIKIYMTSPCLCYFLWYYQVILTFVTIFRQYFSR